MRELSAIVVTLVTSAAAHPSSAAEPTAPNRVTTTLQQDFAFASHDDPCSEAAQVHDAYACFRGDDAQYHGTPDSGSEPVSGMGTATTRLMIGYDRVLAERFTLGARVGYAFGGAPKADGADVPRFLPLHVEAHASVWLGSPQEAGWRTGAMLAGGIGQVDTPFRVRVVENDEAPPAAAQPDNPAVQTLTAYHRAGTGFASLSWLAAYAPTVGHAFVFETRVSLLFPSAGIALSPAIGYEVGF